VPGTACRHFIAELTTYIVVVSRGLPSIYTLRYVEYYCLLVILIHSKECVTVLVKRAVYRMFEVDYCYPILSLLFHLSFALSY